MSNEKVLTSPIKHPITYEKESENNCPKCTRKLIEITTYSLTCPVCGHDEQECKCVIDCICPPNNINKESWQPASCPHHDFSDSRLRSAKVDMLDKNPHRTSPLIAKPLDTITLCSACRKSPSYCHCSRPIVLKEIINTQSSGASDDDDLWDWGDENEPSSDDNDDYVDDYGGDND